MSRKSFVLYTEWEDAFDGQPNDIAGELIKAIFDYVRTEEMPQTDNTVVNAMFSIFKPAIDRNIGKYDAAIKQRKEAAIKKKIGNLIDSMLCDDSQISAMDNIKNKTEAFDIDEFV